MLLVKIYMFVPGSKDILKKMSDIDTIYTQTNNFQALFLFFKHNTLTNVKINYYNQS